ncbi:MAG: acyl-CoA acyltransferase [Rhizomicrobium sp.]
MTIEPQQASRVQCRPIAENDLDGLADLLTRGFPRSNRDYWMRGFSRWKTLPLIEDVPRYGYVLESRFGPVGAVLLLSSRRGGRILSNLSSCYVDPQWHSHADNLISLATKLSHVTYLNASPAPHTWRTLQFQGFVPYNFGRSIFFALPGRGTVSEAIPDDLAEAQLLRDHREMGWISVTVEKDGMVSPFVLKPHRLENAPAAVMDVMFCRGAGDLRRCAPALAKYFLPRGSLGFLIDGDMEGLLSHYVEGKEPRYFKGPYRPILGDLAYTEKVIFG